MKKNKNRGYQQLRVWKDAIEFYQGNFEVFNRFPFIVNLIVSQALASSDSVHSNIAEDYCRPSIREYLNYLNIALGSLGESISGLNVYYKAGHLGLEEFERVDSLAFKLDSGLLKLVESLERKRDAKDWVDSLIIKESNEVYYVD